MKDRRKVTAAASDFVEHINKLIRLDGLNQQRYRPGPGRPSAHCLTKAQMHMLTEGIFISAFSHYEQFVEDIFFLYVRNRPTKSGNIVGSYINPKNLDHARDIIQSGQRFIEWNNSDKVIKRSQTFLDDTNPIKRALTQHLTKLEYMRKIRNAIAHKSTEAAIKYHSVIRSELYALPLTIPSPGEFLLMNTKNTKTYFLIEYLTILMDVANIAVG